MKPGGKGKAHYSPSAVASAVQPIRMPGMRSWIPEAINYQINLRSFSFREPRNPVEALAEPKKISSSLEYARRHLVDLDELGPTVLHLMPPFPIGARGRKGIGSPYAVRDYLAVDPEHGTLDEMRAFVQAAHELGFKVILGMVPNHTSRDHVWVTRHPEFYVCDESGQPVFDADWSDTAKLDYRRRELREAMHAVYDFWLSLLGAGPDGIPEGVDGFRIDMAHLINDLGFWNELIPALRQRHEGRELLFLAEAYGTDPALDLFQRGFNAAYDDLFYDVARHLYARDEAGQSCIRPAPGAGDIPSFAAVYAAFERGGMAGAAEEVLGHADDRLGTKDGRSARWARYTDNHDEGRGVYRFGDGAVLALNQLIFLSGNSIPFLLAGQEFGAENRPSIHTRIGVCDKGYRSVGAHGVQEVPGIEFEGNLFTRDARRRRGWFAFYRDLIALRLATPELSRGDCRIIEPGESCPENQRTVVAFERRHGEGLVRCAVNLGPESRTLRHSSLFKKPPIYGGLVDDTLAPFTAVVVRAR